MGSLGREGKNFIFSFYFVRFIIRSRLDRICGFFRGVLRKGFCYFFFMVIEI